MTSRIENILFNNRGLFISLFFILTLFLGYHAWQIRPDAGFAKWLPMEHEYTRTFLRFQKEFGGANRIMVALMAREGDIFTPGFFEALKNATDDVFFLPGVDRPSVKSLFTPNAMFIEVVEGGFIGGNIIPSGFQSTAENFRTARRNLLKSRYPGHLVTPDFKGALISARLQEIDPATGKRLDYYKVAEELERIRGKYQDKSIGVHITGFAKAMGDITEGVKETVRFFFVTILIAAVLLYLYSRILGLSILPLACSLAAIAWQLGLLRLMGFGLDPMSALVPFLVFAIGVSHGVQMISSMKLEHDQGADGIAAARHTFGKLFLPGGIALVSDAAGFLAVFVIKIEIIREMAAAASVGVLVIILTNLFLLPLLMSYVNVEKGIILKHDKLLEFISRFTERRIAFFAIFFALFLLGYGLAESGKLKTGDLQQGVPELRQDSRFNRDLEVIKSNFSHGVDLLTIFAETSPNACVDYEVMEVLDRFEWRMANVEGVQSVKSLAGVARGLNVMWNEGNPEWKVLPRNSYSLGQSIGAVSPGTGLLNLDCSVMPVFIFTRDHLADTIKRVIDAASEFIEENRTEKLKLSLAGGNVGIMAATNEVVKEAQIPMLLRVYAAITVLCLLIFKSWRAAFCIVAPLFLVSVLCYSLMWELSIGLKAATLPVVALGAGIGVDYGIYIFYGLQARLREGAYLKQAYLETLKRTGNAVLFTGLTLAAGVGPWIFSDLKFQADMGILLTFMFLMNMLGALILLPALAAWLYGPGENVSKDSY